MGTGISGPSGRTKGMGPGDGRGSSHGSSISTLLTGIEPKPCAGAVERIESYQCAFHKQVTKPDDRDAHHCTSTKRVSGKNHVFVAVDGGPAFIIHIGPTFCQNGRAVNGINFQSVVLDEMAKGGVCDVQLLMAEGELFHAKCERFLLNGITIFPATTSNKNVRFAIEREDLHRISFSRR